MILFLVFWIVAGALMAAAVLVAGYDEQGAILVGDLMLCILLILFGFVSVYIVIKEMRDTRYIIRLLNTPLIKSSKYKEIRTED